MMKAKHKLLTLISILALVAVSTFIFFFSKPINLDHLKNEVKTVSIIPKQGIKINPFSLINQDGQLLNEKIFQGKWSLVFFGFSYCPDICPTELYYLKGVKAKLIERGLKNLPYVMLVSLDPIRDTPAQLKKYIKFFDHDFIAVTGEFVEIKKISSNFGTFFEYAYGKNLSKKVPEPQKIPKEYYDSFQVNHSARTYLVNDRGFVVAYYNKGNNMNDVVDDISQIIAN